MKLISSLLLASTAAFAVVGAAQAADLPSKKAAPASYVKICDAYGAGFFYIPGTDTCMKVGGYVRAEYQYTPAHDVYTFASGVSSLAQVARAQNTTGSEMRGRIEVDGRTSTAWGTARTFVRLRLTNNGVRSWSLANNKATDVSVANSTTGFTLEAASIQWAGFTFGVASENYAMMPSIFYHGNAWSGFPNGMKQLAYTATFGGGFSATLAIEDRTDFAYSQSSANRLTTGYNLVGNVKWDQPWGWAAIHAVTGNNSFADTTLTTVGSYSASTLAGNGGTFSNTTGISTTAAYAFGATVNFNLPMLAAGDKLWVTANYTKGLLGAILSTGGLNNLSNSSGGRQLGGIPRIDANLVLTGGAGTAANPYTVGSTTGWNVAAAIVHNWTANWRSQAKAGYVEISPPTSTLVQWGKGRVWEVTHALIFSPAKDFDIGLELQYLNMKNKLQNSSATAGLSDSGWSSKVRVERAF